MELEKPPPPFFRWLAILVVSQTGLAGIIYFISSRLHGAPTGGMTALGHFLGAQAVGSFLEWKFPGQARPLRGSLTLASMTVQLALGLLYFSIFGLPDSPVVVSATKTLLAALIIIPVASGISYGACWFGLGSGIRTMEKQRERQKK